MIDVLWSFGFQLLFIMAIYLIPVFISYFRKLRKRTSLTVTSIFLGWTFIAWVACIVWAIVGETENKQIAEHNA
ncbi:MAG: superinfection immunity protein [Salinivirgaceae bacterium]|nr:superinfection immunity protein [Salinivirgaceae bacterium]